tara:strand:- start:424 stop:1431 length:1008 start_codon:yes stop_codon:yes gene_type:complete
MTFWSNRQLNNIGLPDEINNIIMQYFKISDIVYFDIMPYYNKLNKCTKIRHKKNKNIPNLWNIYSTKCKNANIEPIHIRYFERMNKFDIIKLIMDFDIKPLYTTIFRNIVYPRYEYLPCKYIDDRIFPNNILNYDITSQCFYDNCLLSTNIRNKFYYKLPENSDIINNFINIYLISLLNPDIDDNGKFIIGITENSIYNLLIHYSKIYTEVILISNIHYLNISMEEGKQLCIANDINLNHKFQYTVYENYKDYSNFIDFACNLYNYSLSNYKLNLNINTNPNIIYVSISREYIIDKNDVVDFKANTKQPFCIPYNFSKKPIHFSYTKRLIKIIYY